MSSPRFHESIVSGVSIPINVFRRWKLLAAMPLFFLKNWIPLSEAFVPPILRFQHTDSLFAIHAFESSNANPESRRLEYSDFLPQPDPSLDALDVVHSCMSVLLDSKDAGLEVCFHFSSDRCRAALGGSLERFREYATNPVFGYLVNCQDYSIVSVGPEIAGTTTRGAMRTVLMDAISTDDPTKEPRDERRFLWTLQKERRPPRQNCWMIHEVIYARNAFDLTT
jgi:hypothetical protein